MGCCTSTPKKPPPNLNRHSSRAPPSPHPLLEEETVKEVLSETPTPKPTFTPPNIQPHNNINKPIMVTNEEISETSEISTSLSETYEVRQRVDRSPAKVRHKSFSGDLPGMREIKTPLKRPESFSGRIKHTPGRERSGFVREPGESSTRRSRSPVIRTQGGTTRSDLGRSPSARRTGKSPARVRSELAGKTRRLEPPTTNESLENPLVSLECFIFL